MPRFPLIDLTPDSTQLLALQERARLAGRLCVASAVIVDPHGRTFVQRCAPYRRLFPSCWDIIGGHLEGGETLFAALERPRLESEKVTEFRWVGPDAVHILREHRVEGDTVIYDLVCEGLQHPRG